MGPDCAEVRLTAEGIDRSFGTVDGIAPVKPGMDVVGQLGRQAVPYPQGLALYDKGATAHCIKAVKLDARCDLEPESPSWLASEKQLDD